MTLQQRLDKMSHCRSCGRNCAQAVLMAFGDATGLDDNTAARVANALGSGVAATGEICGVANALAIAAGLMTTPEPSSKHVATIEARMLLDRFAAQHDGHLTCRQLKAPGQRWNCATLIEDGVRLLHSHLEEANAQSNL